MTDFGLSPQQISVICALSSGANATIAAEQAGVHRNTIANWRRNLLPFQHALAHAQYDRALVYREKMEDQADLAIKAIQEILTSPASPAAVRLKAALAVMQTVTTPPPPQKQIQLDIEKVKIVETPEPYASNPEPPTPEAPVLPSQPETESPEVHNFAQTPYRREGPKIGRNDICPCGSGKKFKRCCLDKPLAQAA